MLYVCHMQMLNVLFFCYPILRKFHEWCEWMLFYENKYGDYYEMSSECMTKIENLSSYSPNVDSIKRSKRSKIIIMLVWSVKGSTYCFIESEIHKIVFVLIVPLNTCAQYSNNNHLQNMKKKWSQSNPSSFNSRFQ